MAKIIAVTSFNGVNSNSVGAPTGTTATTQYINTDNIISINTRATAYSTTGITDIQYRLDQPIAAQLIITLVVTETAAAVAASANAASSFGVASQGRATLVAGTVTVSVPGLTSANNVVVSLLTANTTTLTTEYQAVCGTDSIVIRANVAAGTINVADVSTLIYAVTG